jgi:hypothetical protein
MILCRPRALVHSRRPSVYTRQSRIRRRVATARLLISEPEPHFAANVSRRKGNSALLSVRSGVARRGVEPGSVISAVGAVVRVRRDLRRSQRRGRDRQRDAEN